MVASCLCVVLASPRWRWLFGRRQPSRSATAPEPGECYYPEPEISNYFLHAYFGEAYDPYGIEHPTRSIAIRYCHINPDYLEHPENEAYDLAYCVLIEEPDVQPIPVMMHCEVDAFMSGQYDLSIRAVGFGVAGPEDDVKADKAGRKRWASSTTSNVAFSSADSVLSLALFSSFEPGGLLRCTRCRDHGEQQGKIFGACEHDGYSSTNERQSAVFGDVRHPDHALPPVRSLVIGVPDHLVVTHARTVYPVTGGNSRGEWKDPSEFLADACASFCTRALSCPLDRFAQEWEFDGQESCVSACLLYHSMPQSTEPPEHCIEIRAELWSCAGEIDDCVVFDAFEDNAFAVWNAVPNPCFEELQTFLHECN